MSILRTLNGLIDDLELYLEEKGLTEDFAKFRRNMEQEPNKKVRKMVERKNLKRKKTDLKEKIPIYKLIEGFSLISDGVDEKGRYVKVN